MPCSHQAETLAEAARQIAFLRVQKKDLDPEAYPMERDFACEMYRALEAATGRGPV